MTQEELIRIVEKRFGEHTQSVIQAYAQAYPGRSIADLTTYDIFFRKPVIDFVKRERHINNLIYMHMSLQVEFPLMVESRPGIVLIWLLYFTIQIRFPWLICRESRIN